MQQATLTSIRDKVLRMEGMEEVMEAMEEVMDGMEEVMEVIVLLRIPEGLLAVQ